MIFRGALLRLAAWYLLLLALILVCVNVIVYVSLSEALHARVSADLGAKVRLTLAALNVTGGTVNIDQAQLQAAADPTYADTFVFVLQTSGDSPTVVVPNARQLENVQKLPNEAPIAKAKAGETTQTEVDASRQRFAVLTQPIKDKDGNVVGVIQAVKPISQITETLNRLEKQLVIASAVAMLLGALAAVLMAHKSLRPIRVAFQRQRDFVADASHELRTPLTLIRTNAEAWLRRHSSAPGSVHAQHVLDEADHLTTIVGDLTTLALADARQLRLERRPVELSGIIRELVEQTERLAADRRVTLRPEVNGTVRVQADAGRLRQLFLILLDNALEYTPPGGEVSIGVVRQGGRARVTVVDSGVGIAPADLPHIFERFYRADKARSRENGGTGLGLAIAKWIVDVHRGEIDVRSAPGQGTQVAVSLPAIE